MNKERGRNLLCEGGQLAINCYPEPTRFNVEVQLVAGLRTHHTDFMNQQQDTKGSNKHYAGIVARMPRYSPKTMNREREREYMRRTRTADLIGQFVTALATRNHGQRAVGLYTALEARAQVRVQKGLTETAEQVGYMEKLLAAHETLRKAEEDVTRSRISIVAQCDDRKRAGLNHWLKRMSVFKTPQEGIEKVRVK